MKRSDRFLIPAIAVVLAISLLLGGQVYALGSVRAIELTPYWNPEESILGISGKDISGLDLKDKMELLKTLTFDTDTEWPSKDKMPEGFDPKKVLEWGKDPGLGIRKLHAMGYTGKGVNIAYVDQPILVGHKEYKDRSIIYTKIRPGAAAMDTSMHGPAVLSILAGKDTGVAPESTIYYYGHPSWLEDQKTHAEALDKLIELNKTLPENKKVRIVGFSDTPDPKEKNIDAYREAINKAEASGIMVIDVSSSLNINPLAIKYPYDKNDAQYYEVAHWYESSGDEADALYVPTSGRTTACGFDPSQYVFWTDGGLSWAVPYVVGTIALGLQIDPQLTKEEAFAFLLHSGTPFRNGRIINPEGFLNLVKQNYELQNKAIDYRLVLYNGKRVSMNDKYAIENYASRLIDEKNGCVLKDVADYKTAADVYSALKELAKNYKGKIKGIQIFGSSTDVPAFDIKFKIKMAKGIDEGGSFKSDFFYSNFYSDVEALANDFSIYKAFEEKLNVSFLPQWRVARLPLSAGEIAPYINKYYDYSYQIKDKKVPYVNFSNPIFPQSVHSDDMGYFMAQRLDKEFKLLGSDDYRLYGNKEGLYPVSTAVSGGFDNNLLSAENQKGVANFIINSHGQSDNIDQCIYIKPWNLEKYKDRLRYSAPFDGNDNLMELRVSFLNKTNINTILSKNYYTLTLWTCSNGDDLRNDSLAHEALGSGRAIDVMAASSIISNNGVDNSASVDKLKSNNFYYFMYEFFNCQHAGYSRSESFFNAQKMYASEILKHTDLHAEGNYQFNMHNVLSYHYLGVLDILKTQNKGTIVLRANDILPELDEDPATDIQAVKHISLEDNKLEYMNITYGLEMSSPEYGLDAVEGSVDANKIFIRIRYHSPQEDNITLFLQGDAPGLKESVSGGTKKGNNLIVLSFDKDELKSYHAGLAVNIGSRNYLFIDNAVTDYLCKTNVQIDF